MMPLSLFRSRNFTEANAATLLVDFAVTGTMFFLPFNLIWVQGYSATAAGAAIVPTIVLMALLSRFTGSLTDRYGPRLPLVAGSTMAAVGLALFALPGIGGSYWVTFFPAAVVLGIGLSILVPAVTTTALNSVDVRHEGLASAINNAFSQMARLLAIAVLGILMLGSFGSSLDDRLAAMELSPQVRQQLEEEKVKLGAMEAPEGLDATLVPIVERAIDEAFVSGYWIVMSVAATMALASAISAALLIEGKKPKVDTGVVRVEEGITLWHPQTLCPTAWRERAEDSRQTLNELSKTVVPSGWVNSPQLKRGRSPPGFLPSHYKISPFYSCTSI
jgi:MFS family permease